MTERAEDHRAETAGDALGELVGRADGTMIVVTAAYAGERAGCLVGFHCQCSITPARYAVWLSKANFTCRVALQATHLGVHFLGRDDEPLARLFGERTGDEIDKFEHCETLEGPYGVPLLRACPDRVVAERVSFMNDDSDHVCFVLAPVDAHRGGPRSPLRLADVSHLTPGHEAEERPPET